MKKIAFLILLCCVTVKAGIAYATVNEFQELQAEIYCTNYPQNCTSK